MTELTIRFSLGGSEADALRRLAYTELRTPREQTRYVLRMELARRGLLRDSAEVAPRDPQEVHDEQ